MAPARTIERDRPRPRSPALGGAPRSGRDGWLHPGPRRRSTRVLFLTEREEISRSVAVGHARARSPGGSGAPRPRCAASSDGRKLVASSAVVCDERSVSSWYGRYARALKDPAYAAAKARFARSDRRENLLALVTMPALTLLAYVALTRAARLRYESLLPAEYIVVADYSDWLLPGCLIGMLLTALALEVRRHLVLKSQAAERDALDFRLISPIQLGRVG